jgi:zinc/manganese transport system substrate-binding protein
MGARRPVLVQLTLLTLLALGAVACGSGGGPEEASQATPAGTGDTARPTVVVTFPVLGAVVSELVGGAADVVVVMPDGVDPHEFRPSARDVATITSADVVVANGLGLEEGLVDALEQAEQAGVPVFEATDAITVRRLGSEEAAEHTLTDDHDGHDHGTAGDEHAGEEPPDEGAEDPHFWVDPVAMRDVVVALTATLEAELGLDLGASSAALQAELTELDARVRETLSVIPPERRLLVTGHESLGYFADRYGFELVGALIPSATSQAAPSAAELAGLKAQIEALGVPAVFDELGTPPALSRAIADETGARVVELATHTLPEDGSYATFIELIAGNIVEGLGRP